MVVIENITIDGTIIMFDCYEEGNRSKGHHVVFDLVKWEMLNDTQPNIYVRQAIAKIWRLHQDHQEIPSSLRSYWC